MVASRQTIPRGAIQHRVGNLHVSESYLKVGLVVGRALRNYDRAFRREGMAYAMKCHKANRKMYNDVMRGRIA